MENVYENLEKKYAFTNETLNWGLYKLNRIRALKDFGTVKAGDLGGWIETEDNLSHSGDCWVADEAKVYLKAKISQNACILGNANILGNAYIFGDVSIGGDVCIKGSLYLSGDVKIFGKVEISEEGLSHCGDCPDYLNYLYRTEFSHEYAGND
ncbi:hypothetical protein [Bartonella sp. DGB2]|uniref:hypothetical protein n=1 Tax=Bartonella sp. DGB2 TaxID=3388426 RepID=UPI00398FC34A